LNAFRSRQGCEPLSATTSRLGIGTTPPLVRYKRLLHFVGLRLPLRPAYLPRAARPVFDGHPPTEWGHDRDNEA
jgi:hypothetical protein